MGFKSNVFVFQIIAWKWDCWYSLTKDSQKRKLINSWLNDSLFFRQINKAEWSSQRDLNKVGQTLQPEARVCYWGQLKAPNGVRTLGQLNSSYSTIHYKMQFAKVKPFSQRKGNRYLGLNFLPFSSAVSNCLCCNCKCSQLKIASKESILSLQPRDKAAI